MSNEQTQEARNYELTFERVSNGDWIWRREFCRDYHEAILRALLLCPDDCRVLRIEYIPAKNTPAATEG